LEHELEHVRQFYGPLVASIIIGICLGMFKWGLIVGLCLHFALYFASSKYRLWAELRAYTIQAMMVPEKHRIQALMVYAKFIATRYSLNISVQTAFLKLKEKLAEARE